MHIIYTVAVVLDEPYYYWYGHLGKIILYSRLELNWLPVAKTKIHLQTLMIIIIMISVLNMPTYKESVNATDE